MCHTTPRPQSGHGLSESSVSSAMTMRREDQVLEAYGSGDPEDVHHEIQRVEGTAEERQTEELSQFDQGAKQEDE